MEILQKAPHFVLRMATVPIPGQISTLSVLPGSSS